MGLLNTLIPQPTWFYITRLDEESLLIDIKRSWCINQNTGPRKVDLFLIPRGSRNSCGDRPR